MIRSATISDVPVIASLIRALAEYEKLSHEVVLEEAVLEQQLFGLRPCAEVLLAEADQRVVGFALYFQNYSTFLAKPGLYLEDLFVLPEYRGRGLGKQLLIELARVCAARNYGRMEWSVLNWNQPAIDFYQSLGARPLDEWTTYRLDLNGIASLANGQPT